MIIAQVGVRDDVARVAHPATQRQVLTAAVLLANLAFALAPALIGALALAGVLR